MIPDRQTMETAKYSRDCLAARRADVAAVRIRCEVLSPSLEVVAAPELAAFEMKFLVSEEQAQGVERLAAAEFAFDPHGHPALANGYRTTTLYSDTAWLDVFYGECPFKRRKYRVRRYGFEPSIFLERKSRRGDRVKKRRSTVPEEELALLRNPYSAMDWEGHWFHRRLVSCRLRPVCRIAYHRIAYVGQTAEGPLRLTFDREIRGCATSEWLVDPFDGGLGILTGQVVCEFKFRGTMPVFFKKIVRAMRLAPIRISKYRTFSALIFRGRTRGPSMLEWLQSSVATGGNDVSCGLLCARLALSFLLGCVVAAIYFVSQRNERTETSSMVTTLVLLTVLIAMSTLVIGNSVARAFSLLGALAIVRFRTFVADTRDTAFVIFAVVVGMGVGAGLSIVPLMGIPVVALAMLALYLWGKAFGFGAGCENTLTVRLGLGSDPDGLLKRVFDKHLHRSRLISTATARQGAALELKYSDPTPSARFGGFPNWRVKPPGRHPGRRAVSAVTQRL